MATTKKAQEPNIPRLFTQLNNEGEDGDYDKALETADKILGIVPDDPDALYCKVVCLIQLSRFEEAIKKIDEIKKKEGEPQFLFEKAYCLYRTERCAESLQYLDKMAAGDQRSWDLKAQVLYRLERFDEASSAYEAALKQSADSFGNEREANYVAALAMSDRTSLLAQQESLHADTMEQCFNRACCYLAAGMSGDALKMIDLAEDLCRKAEEDRAEDELEDELAVIRVLRGYALQMKGSTQQAMDMYNLVLKQKPSDVSLSVIAANNIIALNKDKDIFDSKKRLKVLTGEASYKKLNSQQKSAVLLNRCLFALQTNQLEHCQELVGELKKKHPNSPQAILSEVALLNRERKTPEAVAVLEEHVRGCPNTSLLIYATLAQLYLAQHNTSMACEVLMRCPGRSSHVGVVSVLVGMLMSLGKVEAAEQVFDEAVAWWGRPPQSKEAMRVSRVLMLESAKFKLQHNSPQAAVLLLEKVLSFNPADMMVLALLISAYSQFSPQRAEDTSKQLPRYGGGPVDIAALEKMPGFRLQRKVVQQKTEVKVQEGERKKKERRKRKRKPCQLKQYDASVPLDLERWLPLRERSYYRRGRKKGFTGIGRGTQGSSAATAAITAQLDASKPKLNAADVHSVVKGKGEGSGKPEDSPQAAPAKKKLPQQQKKKKKTKGW